MIDIKALRENPKPYKDSARQRGISVNFDEVLELDKQKLELLKTVEELRAQLNVTGKPSAEELERLRQTKAELVGYDEELKRLEVELVELLEAVPNLIADDTPKGGEENNREERIWGDAKSQKALDHLTLAEQRGWLDFERGAKVAGNKFYYLAGPLVKLELSVTRLVMDMLETAGFMPMLVPHLVNSRISAGTGYLPRGEEEQVYKIEGHDLNLIATAEIPLAGYHADEIIAANKLPLAYVGLSPAYRVEGGAYGKHSRGLYRVHQLNKIEMFVFCAASESEEWHQKLLALEEQVCQLLEIPYRIVRIAAGDLGAPAYKKFDVEYWSPVEGKYRELMSCSNCTDFQSRRLNIRTRSPEGKTEFVHTLNATGAAFSRIPIAILENHQQSDGSVKVPKALAKIYGGDQL